MKTPLHTLLGLGLALAPASAPPAAQTDVADPPDPPAVSEIAAVVDGRPRLEDAPLADWKRDLLALGFEAASAFPLEPHLKNRARAQERVVTAWIRLDQLETAAEHAASIPNWRKASALADVVQRLVERGQRDGLAALIDDVEQLAIELHDPAQAWRSDRVRAKLAAACVRLGLDERAARLGVGLEPSERWRVDAARAELLPERGFDGALDQLETTTAGLDLDAVSAAVATLIRRLDADWDDAGRRARIDPALTEGLDKLPAQIQLTHRAVLVDLALSHADHAAAREHAEAAEAVVARGGWRAEHHVPFLGQVAGLLGRVGKAERAVELLEAADRLFERDRETIVDMFRAEALRPLALAWFELGEEQRGQEILARLVEESTLNPNSRPRIDDLTGTIVDLVLNDIQPSREVRAAMQDIRDHLFDPH